MSTYRLRGSAWSIAGGILILVVIAFSTGPYKSTSRLFGKHALELSTSKSDLLEHTQNGTLGFQKIFALNLPSRTDHRDALSLAASLTGLRITYIDGVTSVDRKTLPPGGQDAGMRDQELGNWRAHMNAARTMVENDIQTALILEDDADWDLRIKSQMRTFAKATRLLVQPVAGTIDQYLDPTFPNGDTEEYPSPIELYVDQANVSIPSDSPYGDTNNWDLLWIGHCGTHFPNHEDAPHLSLGRAVILDDETVPERHHVRMQFGSDELIDSYPDHTRVVARAHWNLCTLGYALTLQGAHKLLYQMAVHRMDGPTDVGLGGFCDGDEDHGLPAHMCLSVQPQLFQHHRPVTNMASYSDITEHEDTMNEHAFTKNIRWSTRLNLEKLIDDKTDYIDLFQDGKDAEHDFGWR